MRTIGLSRASRSRVAPFALIASLAACKSGPEPTTAPSASPAKEQPPPTPSTPDTSASDKAAGEPTAAAPATDEGPSKPDANAFGIDLYRRTLPTKGNALVSGTSLRAALGIAYLGARGETAKEMQRAVRLQADPDASAASAKAEAAAWESARGEAELAIANRLWADKTSIKIEPSFTTHAQAGYGAGVELVPFATAPEAARTTINTWISNKTKAKIPELLPEGSIKPLTRLVITNAVYFKAAWQSPFKAAQTSNEPFKVDGTTPKPVPMMHQRARLSFAALDGVKVLDLPYAKSSLAMTVILPDDAAGLGKLEAKLDAASLERWTSATKPQETDVTFPKFTFRSGGSVKEALEELGMKRAFTANADFKGIAAVPPDLYVSDVFHKTFVAVDENGTEAAAASAVVMATRGMLAPEPAVAFKADHPFVFLIRDTKTGRVLFLGRVTDPKG